jgi:hypothetical protein
MVDGTLSNSFKIQSTNKINSEFISLCYTNTERANPRVIACTIIHVSCTEIYNFTIPYEYDVLSTAE